MRRRECDEKLGCLIAALALLLALLPACHTDAEPARTLRIGVALYQQGGHLH